MTVTDQSERRRRLQARARSTVLGALALFLLAQVGLRGVIDFVRPELRDPTFEIKYRRFVDLTGRFDPPPTSVLFMGSSMTAFGTDAKEVDRPASAVLGRPVVGYNLAIAASGPFSQLLFLERMLRRGVKPDYVVLEVAAITFSQADPFNEALHFPGQMLSRSDVKTVARYSSSPSELRRAWLEAYMVPIHGHRLTIMNQTARQLVPYGDRLETWETIDEHGFWPARAPTQEEHERVLQRVRATFAPQLAQYHVGPRQVQALRDLTSRLAKERIPTILVWMPEGPLMRSFYPAAPIEELRKEIDRQGFPLVDARTWMDEAAFSDSLHLTDQGAKAFTERLVREAIVPWLQDKAGNQWSRR